MPKLARASFRRRSCTLDDPQGYSVRAFRVPKCGVAFARLYRSDSVLYGPPQRNVVDLDSPDITSPIIAEYCRMGFAIVREVAL